MKSLDICYVVTNAARCSAEWLYDTLYCARGQTENLIKLHESQLESDRTRCRSPLANQMRLVPAWCMDRRVAPGTDPT
jgi:Transposase DDE domain group 1